PSNLTEGGETRDKIAEIANISSGSVHKVEKILERASEADKQRLRSGDVSIHKVYNQIKRQENIERLETCEFPSGKYRLIYADPPWKYGNSGLDAYGHAENHYPCMSIQELCDMPIRDIAEENAVLFLWTTSPLLEDSFKVIKAWGFEYKSS